MLLHILIGSSLLLPATDEDEEQTLPSNVISSRTVIVLTHACQNGNQQLGDWNPRNQVYSVDKDDGIVVIHFKWVKSILKKNSAYARVLQKYLFSVYSFDAH